MAVVDPEQHWEQVYSTRKTTEVGWFQREPGVSLRLIEQFASSRTSSVVDIGGGASSLVDRLLVAGYDDVTVLDVSPHALSEVRARLGDAARRVTFVHHDVLTWVPDRRYDVWHDRAGFHFLAPTVGRDRYVERVEGGVGPGGLLVLGTFAEDGPDHCSGLPVTRYSPEELASVFAASFSMLHHEREDHETPGGVIQHFTWVVLCRG